MSLITWNYKGLIRTKVWNQLSFFVKSFLYLKLLNIKMLVNKFMHWVITLSGLNFEFLRLKFYEMNQKWIQTNFQCRPTPPHLTSVQAEQLLARACENESDNAKRMRMGLEPISQPMPIFTTQPNLIDVLVKVSDKW